MIAAADSDGWRQFVRWAADRAIELSADDAPAPFVIASFLLERLHNTWSPTTVTGKPIAPKYAESLRDGIVRHCADQGWDTVALRGPSPLRDVLSTARTHLPASQVAAVRARPMSDLPSALGERGDIGCLMDLLDDLGETRHLSPLWLARERALILFLYGSGMRIGSTLLLERTDVSFVTAQGGERVATISDWHGKGRHGPDPDLYTIWCCCDEAADRCGYHALESWLEALRVHGSQIQRLFPVVSKFNTLIPLPAPQEVDVIDVALLSGLESLDLSWRTCDSHADNGTATLTVSSEEAVCFECRVCRTHTVAPVRNWIDLRFPCPACRTRRMAEARASQLLRGSDGVIRLVVDRFEGHVRGSRPDVRLMATARKRENEWLAWLAVRAGIPRLAGETLTSHGFRRAFSTKLAAIGASDIEIAQALNHRSPATTTGYIEDRLLRQDHPLRTVPGFEPTGIGEAVVAASDRLAGEPSQP